MPTSARVALQSVAVLALAAGLTAACAKDAGSPETGTPGGATTVAIEMTDDACKPTPASIPAGPVTFAIKNAGAAKVTEAELLRDGVIIGEKENLAPGLTGSFSLKLTAGKYQVYCPNAKTEKIEFTVTGGGSKASADPAVSSALAAATTGYQRFVAAEVDKLIPATKTFTDAVRANDIPAAQAAYAPARYFYEEVEPVAESFGDLDPAVDARADDVADPAQWTGFHRLEKALWQDRSLAGMSTVADRLDQDVAKLRTLVATATFQPAQLANGATELLNEVASRKITGEEDRYSHTDLSDFEANVVGGKTAFDLLAPALDKIDANLAATVRQRFADVLAALTPFKQGTTFVDYSTVGDDKRKELTQKVDALAEPLSQVAAKVSV